MPKRSLVISALLSVLVFAWKKEKDSVNIDPGLNKYWMDETGVTGHKTSFDETWTYIGTR